MSNPFEMAIAKNIGVPDEQDLPAALRDGDIRPQDYNAPLSTPVVISPAEVPLEAVLPKAVEEAMRILENDYQNGPSVSNRVYAAALAVIRAALSQSAPVCREKDDIPCGKEVKP